MAPGLTARDHGGRLSGICMELLLGRALARLPCQPASQYTMAESNRTRDVNADRPAPPPLPAPASAQEEWQALIDLNDN